MSREKPRVKRRRERFAVEVLTASGRTTAVEFRVRSETVEVWSRERRNGVLDRERLRDWLRDPGEPLVADEVMLTLDRMVDQEGRVALSLPDVLAWTLSPTALADLRDIL